MALVGNDWSPADVAALTNGNDGFGGNGAWWIILLFIILGGWGNGFGYGNGGGTDNALQRGFDQSALVNGIGGLSDGIAGVQAALCNGFAQAEIGANARQMADMQQMFALQQQMSQCLMVA